MKEGRKEGRKERKKEGMENGGRDDTATRSYGRAFAWRFAVLSSYYPGPSNGVENCKGPTRAGPSGVVKREGLATPRMYLTIPRDVSSSSDSVRGEISQHLPNRSLTSAT